MLALLLLALVAAVLIGSALIRDDDIPILHGEFTRTGPLTADGTRQAILLEDGRVLLVGSGTVQNTGAEFGVAELFDPATDQVTRLADDPIIRTWTPRGTVRLADGRVLRTGGMQTTDPEGGQRPAPTEIFDPAAESIITIGQLVHPRSFHTATLLKDGRVLIAGGEDSIGESDGPTASAELFDPATGSFRAIDPMQRARTDHQATLLDDGRVLLTGGFGPGPVKSAEVFDPASETFEVVGEIRHARIDHSSTLLADGRVLLVGGSGVDEKGHISDEALTSAELFDPATNSFSEAGALTTERSQHAAVLLEDGRVLIAGGYNRDGAPATTELFDPAAGAFVRGADTIDRIGSTTAALLPDGTVLVVGENSRLELFDPTPVGRAAGVPAPREGLAGTVTRIEPPLEERHGHSATLLADGRVLVVGGALSDVSPFDSAEIYDPRTGRWSPTGSLNVARLYHTSTLLPDGRVLITGGQVAVPERDGEQPSRASTAPRPTIRRLGHSRRSAR